MYTIRLDGELLYSPAMQSAAYTALTPKLSLDVNGAGSLSYVLQKSNRLYHAIRRRKSIVTVHQDGEEIFRGRVMEAETDGYNQKSLYCEGARSCLNDSLAAPYEYTGTAQGLLAKLITEHNAQVEEDKRFTLGVVSAKLAGEAIDGLKNDAYWPTLQEISEKILNAYGGYLKVRHEGGVQYLDWLEEYGRANAQKIRFGVNLLDLQDKYAAGEMFTILLPLGASEIGEEGEYSDPVSIASVNDGLAYIQDDEAVQKYGKIWKAYTWGHIEDPAELLKKAREFLKTGAELNTLTIKAIDMHLMDGSTEAIRVGDKVHIVTLPHGIDMVKTCTKIEIDLENPEESTYTFGEAPRVLTDNVVMAEEEIGGLTGGFGGGGGRSVKEENTGIIRWAEIKVNEQEANINMLAYEANSLENRLSLCEVDIDGINANIYLMATREEVSELEKRVSSAEIEIDGANAEINLRAKQETVDALSSRVGQAEVDIDAANAQINLKASQETVNALGERVSAAEIEIDGANSEIILKADKTYVDSQITVVKTLIADEIEAVYSDVNYSIAESISTKALTVSGNAWASGTLTAVGVSTGSLTLGGDSISKTTIPIVTNFTQALGESAPTQQITLLTCA